MLGTDNRIFGPHSIRRDILDFEELKTYQEMMRYDLRFTVLLGRAADDAESRQVSPVAKLCSVIEGLTERLADFEDYR